ncbi:hypothetical protein ACA910_008555 [Epithemia clementina (nom. ined.)]
MSKNPTTAIITFKASHRLGLCLLFSFLWILEAKKIVVVGSVNADTFLNVERLPSEGENLLTIDEPTVDVPGGKGCTQAIAASKLLTGSGSAVSFICQFGNDAVATLLQNTLKGAGVDVSDSGHDSRHPSGRGYVFLSRSTGQVSAVVSGGSNQNGWRSFDCAWAKYQNRPENIVLDGLIDRILQDCSCLMLQREVPEFVNQLFAAKAKSRHIIVLQDIGGCDRPMDRAHMECCDFLIPNETELKRLVVSCGYEESSIPEDAVERAKLLQKFGARNVLVTQGSRGSTFVSEHGQIVHHQPPAPTQSDVVDETGAGDCYRAAFAVALLEGKSIPASMEFASAAGSLSVERFGAVPSTPTRNEVEHRCQTAHVLGIPRGNGAVSTSCDSLSLRGGSSEKEDFPFLIGSRLNSMKDRPDLWDLPLSSPFDYVKRQATIRGLTCVDFNYPQHFLSWNAQEAKKALDEAGLVAGAVCLRYPSKFARGAMNHPDRALRQEAIELTKEAARTALELGCNEVVVWSAFDGYDYPFQVNYDAKWDELVNAFRECCDEFPNVKFSLEYKPTDENTRFFTVPSTGAAIIMASDVNRINFGLTLDVGHMLMSGENPGQSIAMAGRSGKLFGIQLNDGYTRLAAEDGLMFGSVHPGMALEVMYQLRKTAFDGHLYFDTFPQRSDPVKEAEYNIQRVKRLWRLSGSFCQDRLEKIWDDHDAIEAMILVDESLGSA